MSIPLTEVPAAHMGSRDLKAERNSLSTSDARVEALLEGSRMMALAVVIVGGLLVIVVQIMLVFTSIPTLTGGGNGTQRPGFDA